MTVRRAGALLIVLTLIAMMMAVPFASASDDPPPTTTTTTTLPPDDPPGEDPPPPTTTTTTLPPGYDAPAEDPPAGDEPVPDEEIEFDPRDPEQVLREIVFPVVGATTYFHGFGDCRDGCTRLHNGIDIMTHGWKGVPVVAAHDGRVTWTNWDGHLAGCVVVIEAEDGWTSHYAHLNTDLPGTDIVDDLCFAPGIEIGAWIEAGTILGWIGDSGNAEDTPPHLHFEIRNPDGIPVDAAISLDVADHISYRLIDLEDFTKLMLSIYGEGPTTAFVVPRDGILDAALRDSSYDSPIVPIDPSDPAAAVQALSDMAPERVIVLTHDSEPAYLEDLRRTAGVVEVAALPALEQPETGITEEEPDGAPEATDEPADEDIEITHIFEATEPSTVAVIVGRSVEALDDIAVDPSLVLAFVSTVRVPDDLGQTEDSHPGADANRNGFWWPSADGWLWTEDPEQTPPSTIALVTDAMDRASIRFLESSSTMPAMPLWHRYPTSRTIKSL